MDQDFCLITTAVNDHKFAQDLAKRLVDSRLAACVQLMPISSTYRWKGEVINENEYLLIIKTLSSLYSSVEDAIQRDHPYEIPEILRVQVNGGFARYLDWMSECVTSF